jgi:hypothetical protein
MALAAAAIEPAIATLRAQDRARLAALLEQLTEAISRPGA